MNHNHFIRLLDDKRVTAAIRDAEARTTGEIRVLILRGTCANPLVAAEKHFRALRMDQTRHRNAVLILLAPKSHTFAIFGDVAIHERCGESFWQTLRDEMTTQLKQAHYTDAIVQVIARAGAVLAEHFPLPPGENPNEQPDTVVRR